MLEWKKMPRGSFRFMGPEVEIDVFQIGGQGWRWNILAPTGEYQATGFKPSLDEACEAALAQAGI